MERLPYPPVRGIVLMIQPHITLEQVKDECAAPGAMMFWAMQTCWWTHNPEHLYLLPPHKGHRIPCGPRGEVLMETDTVPAGVSIPLRSPPALPNLLTR